MKQKKWQVTISQKKTWYLNYRKMAKNIGNFEKFIFFQNKLQIKMNNCQDTPEAYINTIWLMGLIHFIITLHSKRVEKPKMLITFQFYRQKTPKNFKIYIFWKSQHFSRGDYILNHCSKFQENPTRTLGVNSNWLESWGPYCRETP